MAWRSASTTSSLLARSFPNVTVTELHKLKTWARGGPSEVARWLQDRAVQRGISIDPRAIEALTDLVGANLRTLATELEKLAMYAGPRAITPEDVRLLTPQAREERIFDLVDAVVEGRAADALRLLRMIRHNAWVARRWSDPAFPVAFPAFGTSAYWAQQVTQLREQMRGMDEREDFRP